MQKIVVSIIKLYRLILSPVLGQNCRFEPSCSRYAEQAVCSHGVLKGGLLGLKRIAKCNPWHPGGDDPVPKIIGQQANNQT